MRPSSGLEGVRTLLSAQGCLTTRFPSEDIRLPELHSVFAELCTSAYGRYYRHPVWEKIRTGDRSALVSWLAHNRELSRSVGQTAARAAARSATARARAVFLRNAIEEYDHFDRFFRVDHPALGVSAAELSAAVPSPATLSFTLQMLAMGEEDWLAHALVAWFQERTERFAGDARAFYDVVEQAAGLGGLFRPWLAHVDYDRAAQHADAFGELLSGDGSISPSALRGALRRASFAAHHLLSALDEIGAGAPPGRDALLRSPPHRGRLEPRRTRLLDRLPSDAPLVFDAAELGALARQVEDAGLASEPIEGASCDDTAWLASTARRGAILALGHSERDADILACGALVEAFARGDDTTPEVPLTPACAAVGAYLLEAARAPVRFCAALRGVLSCAPIADVLPILDRRLEHERVTDLDGALLDLVQTAELLSAWRRECVRPPEDVFSW